MFTGIIEEVGQVARIGGGSLVVNCAKVIEDVHLGDSIAVNGVCLTVTHFDKSGFTADVMPETVRRTSLAELKKGSPVNLERALTLASRLGGHIVSGHIDGTGVITDMTREDNAVWITVNCTGSLLHYMIEKGSIAIDGISLTLAYVDDECFKVSVIPHTGEETILLQKKPGDTVNLECDLIGKYVEKLLFHKPEEKAAKSSSLDMNFLRENGFL